MSIHISALRDIASSYGWPVCDEAADEIKDLEDAYALLFAENAKLKALNAELAEALADVIGWVPSSGAWHTNAARDSVEKARSALLKVRES